MPPAAVLALPTVVFAFSAPAVVPPVIVAIVIVVAMEPAIVVAAIMVAIVPPFVIVMVMVASGCKTAARQRHCQSQCCQFETFHVSPPPVAGTGLTLTRPLLPLLQFRLPQTWDICSN